MSMSELPEQRPMSDAEWNEYLSQLAMMQLIEEYGPVLQEQEDGE